MKINKLPNFAQIIFFLLLFLVNFSFAQKKQIDTLFLANNKYPIERIPSFKTFCCDFKYDAFQCQYKNSFEWFKYVAFDEDQCKCMPYLNEDGFPEVRKCTCDTVIIDTNYVYDFKDTICLDFNSIKYNNIFIKQGLKKILISNCDFTIIYEKELSHLYVNDFERMKDHIKKTDVKIPKLIILHHMVYFDSHNILYTLPFNFIIYLKP